ncbi:ankyrin repeat protein [Dactylonectria estremocensis]|uniref:Ankyrin repeat protein n=1 Tax=Dactylonectria estremocensis TaxID=1079267 RepID=A0A9P9FFQ5_9HYPO|nr:ankyrin repeat protein [Dactylonectria estremocensis]
MAEVAFGALEAAVCITEVVKLLYNYINGVKDAKDDIRKLTQELFALKGALEHFHLHGQMGLEKSTQPQLHSMLQMTQESLNSIQTRLDTPRSSTFGKIVTGLSWPFKSREIQKHLGTIERAKTWFVMVILKDSSEVTLAVYDEMKMLVQMIHQDTIDKETRRMIQETDDLLAWLGPVNVDEMLQKATQNKIPGTGRWVLNDMLADWIEYSDVDQPLIWITSKSGSGKTVLFSTIIGELRQRYSSKSSANVIIGYHCCSLDDAASQQVSNIFGSILAKAGTARPDILQHIAPFKRSSTSLVPQNNLTVSEVAEIMAFILDSCDRFYLLVDALNETPHEEELVKALLQLCAQHSKIRILVTCTREPLVSSPAIKERVMDVDFVNNDIEAYVLHRLATESCFRVLSPKIHSEIQQKIISGADGMFRWAKLCMDRLSVLRTGRDVKDALQNLPTTLNDSYVAIFGRILNHDREIAREALTWLCFSLRPLTLDELAEAVVLRETDVDIDDDCRLTRPLLIVDICRDLVSRSDNFVTLAHDSIRTFLTSQHIRGTPVAFFALDPAAAHARILRKCLCYLSLGEFASGPVDEVTAFYRRIQSYPLVSYAATYWPIHSENCTLTPDDESLILSFFDTKKLSNGSSFDSWVQLLLETQHLELIKNTEPLYYAASFNMLSVLKILLRPSLGTDLNRPGGRFGSSPLFVAMWRGNLEAAKLLLEAGADASIMDKPSLMTGQELAHSLQLTELLQIMEELPKQA